MNYEHEIKKLEDHIAKAEEQIKNLKAEAELAREPSPVWVPEEREVYYSVGRGPVHLYTWLDDPYDKTFLEVGNVFKTEQEAGNYLRASKLVETIRRERFKAQGSWWSNELTSYTVYWDWSRYRADIDYVNGSFSSDVFGCWKELEVLESVMKKYKPEFEWYFTKYLPSVN